MCSRLPVNAAVRGVSCVAALCLIMVCPGCAERTAGGAGADAIASREARLRPTVQPVDTSGPVSVNHGGAAPTPRAPGAGPATPADISSTVDEAVRPVQEEGFQDGGSIPPGAPAPPNGGRADGPSPPAVPPAPDTTGDYQLVGTVLAEVNGTPIFADKVLATVDAALAAQARRLDEREFRGAAAKIIEEQVREYVATELEYALAQRQLEARDAQLAKLATIRWRDEQVTKAGGSLELARQRAAAAGYDFDELAEEQERLFMRRLYYEKREYPKIQVSASDMRRYYQENLQREFTAPDRARFRVIKVDKRQTGGRQQALGEINRLLDRVRSGGKDFAELAAEDNDEESFKRPVDWFQRGSFVVKEVEDAVWKLQPGQVTDVIETPDAFYIARLEALQPGGARPFNDPDVQKRIEATLRRRQFDALRQKVQAALIDDAIIRYHPRMIELAVEMAMQKYRYWRASAEAR